MTVPQGARFGCPQKRAYFEREEDLSVFLLFEKYAFPDGLKSTTRQK
jgi:hypothetical protein